MIAFDDEIDTDNSLESIFPISVFADPSFLLKKQQLRNLISKQNSFRVYNKNYAESNNRAQIWFYEILQIMRKLEYSINTFLLGLSIFDFISAQFVIEKKRLKTFCILIFDIASKIHEPQNKYRNLVKEKDNIEFLLELRNFANNEIVQMQKKILTHFDFAILIPTCLDFAILILEATSNLTKEGETQLVIQTQAITIVSDLLLSASSCYNINRFTPFLIACSVVFCFRRIVRCKILWPDYLKDFTELKKTDIEECVDFIVQNQETQLPNSKNQNLKD